MKAKTESVIAELEIYKNKGYKYLEKDKLASVLSENGFEDNFIENNKANKAISDVRTVKSHRGSVMYVLKDLIAVFRDIAAD